VYILDALESIKEQSYSNIELIISDDCSTDNTVNVCLQWINRNENRFVRVKLITSPVNTGVSQNVNRGLYEATGDWIKLLAGDDALETDCIKLNLEYVYSNPNAKVLHSNSRYYREVFSESTFMNARRIIEEPLNNGPLSLDYQRRILLFSPSVNAPTIFIERNFIKTIGYFDGDISSMDDWPFWIKINNSGTYIFGMDQFTVKYRVREGSLSNDGSFINSNFTDIYAFQKNYLWKELTITDRFFLTMEFQIKNTWRNFHIAEKGFFFKLIYYGLIVPGLIYRKIRVAYYRSKFSNLY